MTRPVLLAAMLLGTGIATADELTLMVETDLAALGYATGPVDGQESMETVIAVSKFQAENDLEVTGEITPQLAGILSAKAADPNRGSTALGEAPSTNAASLQAAQQACLQEKIAAAQQSQRKKRGFGSLLRAVARTAGQNGDTELVRSAQDIYTTSATVDDLASAARDLGLTEDDVAACENPPGVY